MERRPPNGGTGSSGPPAFAAKSNLPGLNAAIPRRTLPPPAYPPQPQSHPPSTSAIPQQKQQQQQQRFGPAVGTTAASAAHAPSFPRIPRVGPPPRPSPSASAAAAALARAPVPRKSLPTAANRQKREAESHIAIKSEHPFVLRIKTKDVPISSGGIIPQMRSSRRESKRKRRPIYEELQDTDSDDFLTESDEEEEPVAATKRGRLHKVKRKSPSEGMMSTSTSTLAADGVPGGDDELTDEVIVENAIDSPPPGTLSTLWYSREVFSRLFVIEKIIGWKTRPIVKLDWKDENAIKLLDPVEAEKISSRLLTREEIWTDQRKRMEMSRINPAHCPIVMAVSAAKEAEDAKSRQEDPRYVLAPSQEDQREEVLFVKWRGRSHMHCSWERRKDLEKFDPSNTARNKIRRYIQNQEMLLGTNWKDVIEKERGGDATSNDAEGEERTHEPMMEEEETIPPQYMEVERILACDESEMDMNVLARQRAFNIRREQEEMLKRDKAEAAMAESGLGADAAHVHSKPPGLLENLPKISDGEEPWDPEDNVRYVVKWKGLQYSEITWEYWRDIKRDAVDEAEDFWYRQRAPSPSEVSSILSRPHPHVRDFRKLAASPEFAVSHKPRPVADLGDGFEEVRDDEDNGKAFTLRIYQLEGVNWLLFNWFNKRSCILADEMGLGKTIQTVCFLHQLHTLPSTRVRGPFLVVAPLTLIGQWQSESQTWAPDLNVIFYHGSADARDFLVKQEFYYTDQFMPKQQALKLKKMHVTKFHILITTYEVVLKDVEVLSKIRWKALVVDEAHRLKNPKARLFEELATVPRDFCLLLTGTPLQNSTEELWSLLHFADPKAFASKENFVEKFGQLTDAKQVSDLHAMLKPYLLRRVKEDVEKSLPPKEETILEVSLTPMQKTYYKAIYERNTAFLFKGAKPSNAPSLMNVMMELRKCCNHPFLIRGAEERILNDAAAGVNGKKDEEGTDVPVDFLKLYGEQLVKSSGKMVLLEKLLPKLFSGDHKVLIFSQMVKALDLLEELLKMKKYRYERLDGGTSATARSAAVHRFHRKSCQRFVMLLSTRAGGLGLNLTAADTVIIFDSDWNPQNDLQAMARSHRIGQTRRVSVYRLLTAKTYEMHMFHSASLKLGLDRAVLAHQRQQGSDSADEGKSKSKSEKEVQAKEIDELLKKGAYDVFRDDDDTEAKQFMETDIDQLLERSSTKVTYGDVNASSLSSGLGSFSKASFVADTGDGGKDVDLDDPDFWEKAVGLEAPEETPDEVAVMIDDGVKRNRKQVQVFDPYAAFADAEQKKKDKIASKAKAEKEEKERLRLIKKQRRLEEKERKKREREEAKSRAKGQSAKKARTEESGSVTKPAKEHKPKKLKKSQRLRALKRAENKDPVLERLKQAWEVPQRNRATSAALRFGFGRFCKIRNESNLASLPLQDLEIFVRSYVYQLSLQVAVTLLALLRSKEMSSEQSALQYNLRDLMKDWLGAQNAWELEWICNSISSAMKMQIEVENRRRFLRMPLILAEPSYASELRQGAALRALRRICILNRLNDVVEGALDSILSRLGHEELGKRGAPTKDLDALDADLKARHATKEELILALGELLPYSETEGRAPAVWWDRTCDLSLIIGTFVHGMGNYEAMRNDEDLPYGNRIREYAEMDDSCSSAFLLFSTATQSARKTFDVALENAKSKAQEEAHAVVAAVVAATKQAEKEGEADAKVPSEVAHSSIVDMDADDLHLVTLPRLRHAVSSSVRVTPGDSAATHVMVSDAKEIPITSSSEIIVEASKIDDDDKSEENEELELHHRLPMPDARILDRRLVHLLDVMEHSASHQMEIDHEPSEGSCILSWEASKSVQIHEEACQAALFKFVGFNKQRVEAERQEFSGVGFSGNQCGTVHRSLDDMSDFSIGAASAALSYVATGTDAQRYLRAVGVPMNLTRYAILGLVYADGPVVNHMLDHERRRNMKSKSGEENQPEKGNEKDKSDVSTPEPVKEEPLPAVEPPVEMRLPEVPKDDRLRAGISAAAVHLGFPTLNIGDSPSTVHASILSALRHHVPTFCENQDVENLFSLSSFKAEARKLLNSAADIGLENLVQYVESMLLPHCFQLCLAGNGPGTRNARGSKGKYETAYGYSLCPEHMAKRQTPLPDPCLDLSEHSIEAVTYAAAMLRRVRLMRAVQHLASRPANDLLEILKLPALRHSMGDLPVWWCPWIHDLALVVYAATRGLCSVCCMRQKNEDCTIFSERAVQQHIDKFFVQRNAFHTNGMSEEEIHKWVQGQAAQFPTPNVLERRLGWVCSQATDELGHEDPARYDHLPMFDHGGWPRN